MKKLLTTAALSSVLIMGGATVALATHAEIPAETSGVVAMGGQVVLDGSIRVRGFADKRDNKDEPANTGYDARVRLGTKARISEKLMGYVQLETGDDSSDNWSYGAESDAALMTGGSKDNNDLEILQGWLDYSPGNWGIKVGHMPLALGNKLFFDHTGSGDDAIVLYGNVNGFEWNALTIKFQENAGRDSSDDLDGYVLNLTNTFNGLKANVNYTFLKGGSAPSAAETAAYNAAVAAATGQEALYLASGSAQDLHDLVVLELAADALAPEPWNGLSMSNLGIALDYKMGDLALKADGEFQFGDFSDNGITTVDAGGWAMMLSGDYKLGGGSVGLLFGYGSGDDNSADNDQDTFITFLTDTAYQVYIPGYRLYVPGTVTTSGKYTGLSNLTLYQLNGSTAMTCPLTGSPLSIRAALSYMELSEEVTVGTAKEDEVGTELDVVATWQLTDGLAYVVELAYLWTGDAFKDSPTDDPDDAYFFRHGLEMKF